MTSQDRHSARVSECGILHAARRPGSIADVIALEHAASDKAHVTSLPLVHCQQYVRRNAALIEQLRKEKA